MSNRTAFKETDFLSGDVAVVNGSFIKIGEYQVKAGELKMLGYGDNESQAAAPGRIYVDMKDTANAAMDGVIRFAVHHPSGQPLRTLAEYRTEALRTNLSDRTLQIPFPSNNVMVSEDKKIVIEFNPDADGTVSKTNTKMLMDATEDLV